MRFYVFTESNPYDTLQHHHPSFVIVSPVAILTLRVLLTIHSVVIVVLKELTLFLTIKRKLAASNKFYVLLLVL